MELIKSFGYGRVGELHKATRGYNTNGDGTSKNINHLLLEQASDAATHGYIVGGRIYMAIHATVSSHLLKQLLEPDYLADVVA